MWVVQAFNSLRKNWLKKQTEPTEKQEKAIEYTQKVFENHIENPQDLESFYKEIIAYSNGKTNFSNSKSIIVKDLINYDLCHFGWNIWNHFKVGKQEIIANFLHNIFTEKLGNQTKSTIIKHLCDDEKKGKIILLKKILLNFHKINCCSFWCDTMCFYDVMICFFNHN